MVKSLYNIQLTNNTWNLRSKPTINWDLPKDNIIYVESSWLFEDNEKVIMVKLKGLMYMITSNCEPYGVWSNMMQINWIIES